MSYSGQSNPPWQRNTLGNTGQTGTGLGLPNLQFQNQSIFGQNVNMGQQSSQHQNVGYSQYSGNANQMLQAPPAPSFSSVSYPQGTRNLNPIAFSSGNTNQQSSSGSTHSQGQGNNYNSVGTVTKIHNDCGFVDDEVFFHKSVCKGSVPKLGDRVLVEATFNSNSPFKWNATRIQMMGSGSSGSGSGSGNIQRNQPPPLMGTNVGLNVKGNSVSGSGYNAVPPPNEYGRLSQGHRRATPPPPRRSPDRHGGRRDSKHRDNVRNVWFLNR